MESTVWFVYQSSSVYLSSHERLHSNITNLKLCYVSLFMTCQCKNSLNCTKFTNVQKFGIFFLSNLLFYSGCMTFFKSDSKDISYYNVTKYYFLIRNIQNTKSSTTIFHIGNNNQKSLFLEHQIIILE